MSNLVDRITEVLLANSFGKFKDETGDGFSAYAAHVAERIAAALNLTEEERSYYDHAEPFGTAYERRWVSEWTTAEETS